MSLILSFAFQGALWGACGAIVVVVIGFCIEFLNVGCAILTCDCNREFVFAWSGGGVFGVFLLCIIGGAIIGSIYGLCKAKEFSDAELARKNAENTEEARKQRVKWASEVKQKALNVNNICSKNKEADKPLVFTDYKANDQMIYIMSELTKIAELQGKIDSLIEELSEKGGIPL